MVMLLSRLLFRLLMKVVMMVMVKMKRWKLVEVI